MTFRTPDFLWLLLLVPPWIVLYRWILRRPSRETIKHAHVALIRMAAGRGQALRRHAAAVLFLLALAAVILALGRPVAPLPVPSNQTAVMLSIDVSRSMLAQDMHPNRLEAAKTAAREFVKVLPRGTRVGLVTFSSYASLIVPPTADHGRVVEAIDDLSAEFATAIGDGLLEAVWALPGRTRPEDPLTPPREPRGALPPAVVVLLSDGQSNRGALPSEAARIAKQQQIKVYTVGIGTP
ncbi:MAG: VWA domain-containing protein, partial [Armatimonadetes bacterium]|nr:VWA domain-containing protein [Armatimonadota bacterium]